MKSKKQSAAPDSPFDENFVCHLVVMAEDAHWPPEKISALTTLLDELIKPLQPGEAYHGEVLRSPEVAANEAIPRSMSDEHHGITPGASPEDIRARARLGAITGTLSFFATRDVIIPPAKPGAPPLLRREYAPGFEQWGPAIKVLEKSQRKFIKSPHAGASEIALLMSAYNRDIAERGIENLGDIVASKDAYLAHEHIGEIVTRAWLSDDCLLFEELARLLPIKARNRSDLDMEKRVKVIEAALHLRDQLNRDPTRKELADKCEKLDVRSWSDMLKKCKLRFLDKQKPGRKPNKPPDHNGR